MVVGHGRSLSRKNMELVSSQKVNGWFHTQEEGQGLGEITGWSQHLAQPSPVFHIPARRTWRSFMRQRTRGWVMPDADILSLLRLIDERVSSPKIEVRHRDALIRLRDILEDDLRSYRSDELPKDPQPQ